MNTKALAAAAAVTVGCVLSGGAAFAATGGYGPTAPTGPAGTPGGFSSVVAAQTVDSTGGTIAGSVAGGSLSVVVPPGAFSVPVQVEVTKPDLAAITPAALSVAGFSGYRAVAGLGVKVLDAEGTPMTGTFAKPLDVTISGSGLGAAGQKVLELNGSASASVVGSSLGVNSITVHLNADPNLVVVDPTGRSTTGVPGATQQVTGKPYHGQTLAALGLIVTGGLACSLAFVRRRKPSAFHG